MKRAVVYSFFVYNLLCSSVHPHFLFKTQDSQEGISLTNLKTKLWCLIGLLAFIYKRLVKNNACCILFKFNFCDAFTLGRLYL